MSNHWYVKIDNVEHGPLMPETLRQLAQQGKVTPETFVKQGVSGTWLKASHVNGLFSTEASTDESTAAAPSPKPASSLPIAKPLAPAPANRTARTPTRAGFWAYCVQNFTATRWLECIGICLGILAIPFVSLLKPVLGFRGLCFVLAGAAGLSVVSGMVYLFWCLIAYYKRSSPNRAWSFMAPLAYGGLMFLVPMAPWITAEYFAPPHGLLATICPAFQEDQVKWFGLPTNKEKVEPSQADSKPSDTASSDRKTFIVTFRHPNHKKRETAEIVASTADEAKQIVMNQYPGVGDFRVTPKLANDDARTSTDESDLTGLAKGTSTVTFEGKYTWEKEGQIIEFLPGGKVSKSWNGANAEWLSLGESKYKILHKEKDKHHHEHIMNDFVTMMPDGSLSVYSVQGGATVTWTASRISE